MILKTIYLEGVCHQKPYPQNECFYCFLINDHDALVKQCIETVFKICKEKEILIEERRVRRKKKMLGEHAEDVGLSAEEEIKRCLLEATN